MELEASRKETKALQLRRETMEKKHTDNMAKLKRICGKETKALQAKVDEIDRTDKILREHLDFVDKEYTQVRHCN